MIKLDVFYISCHGDRCPQSCPSGCTMVSFLGEVAARFPPASITVCTWLAAVLRAGGRAGGGSAATWRRQLPGAQALGRGAGPGVRRTPLLGHALGKRRDGHTAMAGGPAVQTSKGLRVPWRVLLPLQAGTHSQFAFEKADLGRKPPAPRVQAEAGPRRALCAAPTPHPSLAIYNTELPDANGPACCSPSK